jgi:hypothetical protein
MDNFRIKLAALDNKMSGWSLLETSGRIAEKIRKYMLIRTLASVATGVAVFLFTLAIGLDLAVAWGIISFVLNYPLCWLARCRHPTGDFRDCAIRILADGSDYFRKLVRNPICHRQAIWSRC